MMMESYKLQQQMYTQASTTLSLASIRQQFSLPENIQMAQYGFQFFSEIKDHLSTDDSDPPDIQLHKGAYLFLCSKSGEATLKENYKIQRELGCDVALLSPNQLNEKFPWLNTEGVTLSSIGTANEGWFDPWALLQAFKRKAISLGVDYITGEAVDFVLDQKGQVSGIKVITDGSALSSSMQTVHCGTLVNAAGPSAGYLAKKLGIHLPVEPRKRNVFVLDCPAFSGHHDLPLLVDPTGAYIRPETSGYYLSGIAPAKEDDQESFDLEVDYDLFDEKLWPIIANRLPAFECLKVQSAWAGHYEYNTLDQNAIIGRHPEVENVVFVNGFSGHGIQQSPAAGRAVSELILDSGFQTIDLSRLGYERVLKNEPFTEKNIV